MDRSSAPNSNRLPSFNGHQQVGDLVSCVLDQGDGGIVLHLGDNNARILYYELQYNTSFQPTSWISVPIEQRRESFNEVKSADGSIKLEPKTTSRRGNHRMKLDLLLSVVFKTTHLPSNQYDLQVPLSCWGNYTFRLIAYNRIGASEASLVSQPMCSTETCRPKTNPSGVRAATTQTSPLIIEWDVSARGESRRARLIRVTRTCRPSNGVPRSFGTKWRGVLLPRRAVPKHFSLNGSILPRISSPFRIP